MTGQTDVGHCPGGLGHISGCREERLGLHETSQRNQSGNKGISLSHLFYYSATVKPAKPQKTRFGGLDSIICEIKKQINHGQSSQFQLYQLASKNHIPLPTYPALHIFLEDNAITTDTSATLCCRDCAQ